MATSPGSLNIGGKSILGFTIPKIEVAGAIKKAIGPGAGLKEEIANTVSKGAMRPVLIGAGLIALAILAVAFFKNKGGG